MRTKGFILALSLSIAVVSAAPIGPSLSEYEQPTSPVVANDDIFEALNSNPQASSYLIEFNLPPAGITRHERLKMEVEEFEGQAADRHAVVAAQHQELQDYLKEDLQIDYAVRHEFFDLMNGLSIDLEGVSAGKLPQVLEKIRELPGVIKISPLISLSQPKTIVHDVGDFSAFGLTPQLSTAHEQTGVLDARNKLNLAGHGVKVGIIDTGVDYTHEALGSCYGPGCKVQFGYDFVDPYRREAAGGYDCVGHGTHVAGIIAGKSAASNFFGVAPEATLGAYRVFPCGGNSKDDVIIAALEKAYYDGMDVVNLSLGGGSSWANTALSKAAGNLANLGVVVVAAIGNDGGQGLFEVSSPSINSAAISVGSFEGAGYLSNYFQVGVNSMRFEYSDAPPKVVVDQRLNLIIPSHDIEGCSAYPESLNGAVSFIKRGSCTFAAKAKMAQDAGAVGCIFYNNIEGVLRPKVDEPGIHIFGHGISMQQGQRILDQFKDAASVQVTYKSEKGVFSNEMANQMSPFSSWGLGPELEVKPDIAAPGGYIYSTVPVAMGSFSTMSGTSMATPFIAGTAALMIESNPTMDRRDVLGRLQMYSKPGLYMKTDVPDTVVRQGAGMVHIYDAIRGQAFVQPAHLALNDTDHTLTTYTLALTNTYPTSETFTVSHVPAMSILGFNPEGQPTDNVIYSPSFANMGTDQETFTLDANATHVISLKFTPPANLDPKSHWFYSGYVRITPTNDITRPAIQVPYAGMAGSYGTVDMLDLQSGFPIVLGAGPNGRLAPIPKANGPNQPAKVYSMYGNDIMTLLLKISNPLHNLQIYVMDMATQKVIGAAPVDGEYIGRTDLVHIKFFVAPWSGRIITDDQQLVMVPDGEYSLVVIAPKPFSDAGLSGGERESWMSPRIAIKRRTRTSGRI
ncbi:hypothetical protein BG006_003181 [Podila minutissima]|uniref:Uncharacterized protein n=1 Tax=Podila minutissima TaxID=64525 RepID=A0A9P5SMD2_9FUNG|nr:hypothetical protein BG006_003181 [Podila minutissima]